MDIVFFVLLFMVAAFVIMIVSMGQNILNEDVKADDTFSTESKAISQTNYDNYKSTFDIVYLLAVIGFMVAAIASVFMLDSNPIFFWVFFVLVMIIVPVAGALANGFYDSTTGDDDLGVERTKYTYIPWIMDNYIMITVIFTFMLIIALFAKGGAG